jgi:hypothetical protein
MNRNRSFWAAVFVIAIASSTTSLYSQELRRSGFLGVAAVPLSDDARRQLKADETGILVQNVLDNGTAKAAGIQPGDVITEINDHKVSDVNDFVQTAKGLRAGDTPTIHFWRGGEEAVRKQDSRAVSFLFCGFYSGFGAREKESPRVLVEAGLAEPLEVMGEGYESDFCAYLFDTS